MSIRNKANNRKKVKNKPKILVILGPTSSGKTTMGVKLALAFNGEIISADSRQVYRGMDIGTGKDLGEYKVGKKLVKYHLIDVADPKEQFDVAHYQCLARRAIDDILQRKKLPIIVGGSGLYLQALVDNYNLTHIKPNLTVRTKLEKLSVSQLFNRLEKIKPNFAARLNNSDRNNPRRLARYLEIAQGGGTINLKQESPYDFLILGLTWPNQVLRERSIQRLLVRLEKEGLIFEVHHLHQQGISWERLESFGLEYRFVAQHLLGQLSYNELVEKLGIALYHFAKKQLTWFKRWERQGQKIKWVKKLEVAKRTVQQWL